MSELEQTLWFPIGSGDVSFKVRDLGLRFDRSRRLQKASGTRANSLQLPWAQLSDVVLRSTGGPPTLSVTPTDDAKSLLLQHAWPPEQLTVRAPTGEAKRDQLERGYMFIAYRYLVDRLGHRRTPTRLEGLNGSMTVQGTHLMLEPPANPSPPFSPLTEQTYSFSDIVDVYLIDADRVTSLMVLDRTGTETLLAGEASYSLHRTLWTDVGQWPDVAGFYELLPRFGDRPAQLTRNPPDDSLVAAAYESFVARHDRLPTPSEHGIEQPGLADELERLASLHASGILSAEEFETAKAKLLS